MTSHPFSTSIYDVIPNTSQLAIMANDLTSNKILEILMLASFKKSVISYVYLSIHWPSPNCYYYLFQFKFRICIFFSSVSGAAVRLDLRKRTTPNSMQFKENPNRTFVRSVHIVVFHCTNDTNYHTVRSDWIKIETISFIN